MLPPPLVWFVVGVTTTLWAANLIAGMLPLDYQPDPYVHGVYMTVVGGALALRRRNEHSEVRPPPAKKPRLAEGDDDRD